MTRQRFIAGACFFLLSLFGAGAIGTAGTVDDSLPTEETVYASDDIEIAATLLLPKGRGPFPAAVFIQGSGDSSRRNLWARMIAQELAARGVAVFLPDKRGTGDSGGDLDSASFELLAADISAAVDFVAGHSAIDPRTVGVVGLSQGGFYAPLVAVKNNRVRFVAGVSSSVLPFEATIEHEMRNTFLKAGLTGDALTAAMALQDAAGDFVRTGDWAGYRCALDEALAASGNAEVVSRFPQTRDAAIWSWLPLVIDFDPMTHWRRVDVPIFIAYGERDESDNVPVQESARRIRQDLGEHDVTLKIYPESGHALYDPVLASEGEASIRGDFADDLAGWIIRHRRH